jgi:signal transduction histidine kinase
MIREVSERKKNKSRIEILKSVVIFSESNKEILKKLASKLEDIEIKKGKEVFHKDDHLNAMYIIVSGSVLVHDDEHVFTKFGANDFFGEYSLIDSSARSATVTAQENTHLLSLNQNDFTEIIENNVDVSKGILKALIKRLRNNNILEERLTKSKLEIEKQKIELEELNATKDKFFTIIAHDLKNPFNTVIGLTELLLERYNSYDHNKIIEFIGQVNKFSNNAYNLLEDLLQWAKSQTGRMEVKFSKIDLFELIIENKSLLEEKADKKRIQVITEAIPGEYAFIDRNMITTVIRNLLSNAIKFTKSNGTIVIKTEKKGDFYDVLIKDNGIGIPKENLERLFKIDSNLTTLGTEDESGTGLGLILSKEFIDKNNGTISVISAEGIGTTFKFTIPAYSE